MSDSIRRRRIMTTEGICGRSPRTRRPVKHHRSRRIPSKIRSKSTKILNRSLSEPNLHRSSACEDDDQSFSTPIIDLCAKEPEQIVYLSKIRSEVFASAPSLSGFSSPSSSSPSPINQQVNRREANKVVISVLVEGSPGPVRTLLTLSCNVEETIKMVVEKYSKEGRTPKLDKDLAFELHQSHFSIQCLEKTQVIGEIGSRNFYMRKREPENNILVRRNLPSSNMIESFIAQKFGRIVRRTRKIWNILVCSQ